MDPHAVLGLAPGASAAEATASYREMAKRWHPDRGGGEAAQRRMAEINAAYDLLRAELWQQTHRRASEAAAPVTPPVPQRRRCQAGSWLPEATRRALGPELLAVLHRGEDVRLVTPAAVWASPQALLAVTDRRLLWLLDDAVTGRVRSLDLAAITGVETKLSWPRRRTATVRVRRRNGRRSVGFSELRPETARALSGLLSGRAAAA